ncbi:DUF6011 domain-containing protein [Micromonospora yangpuensis]|uniref:Uncharacterized protein n=1 Tax=Micromonospora yangpuensis TaxID=683228 RepID=A0A1C6VED4_9ACTN|nr:DUF6011 domain-containing protein [Micromonospora yangpuensis]GGM14120.1 hypothetical protein GCM10012279_35300 [Micromonospora yangpuensis]SCL64487.1 hypothetical protein GA0070617_5485 [Micromonospora yangpuensis]
MTPVLCLVCERPLRTPVSRARRIGSTCWRRLRAEERTQAAALFELEVTSA